MRRSESIPPSGWTQDRAGWPRCPEGAILLRTMRETPSVYQEFRYFFKDHRVFALSAAGSVLVIVTVCAVAALLDASLMKRAHADALDRHARVERLGKYRRAAPAGALAPSEPATPQDSVSSPPVPAESPSHRRARRTAPLATAVPRRGVPARAAAALPPSPPYEGTRPVEVRTSPAASGAPTWTSGETEPSAGTSSPPAIPPPTEPEPLPEGIGPEVEVPPTPEPGGQL